MKKTPTYALTKFNCALTVRQKQILYQISTELKRPIADIVREAVHCWLRERGVEDGLIYDREDFMREWEREMGWQSTSVREKSSET